MRLAVGSPQADLRQGRLPTDVCTYVWNLRGCPHGLPLRSNGSKQKSMSNPGPPTSRITTREVPHPQNYDQALHKQNYDQGAYILPTSRITTRELASWLAGWLGGLCTTRKPVLRLAGWLVGWGGWLAGWLVGFCTMWHHAPCRGNPCKFQQSPSLRQEGMIAFSTNRHPRNEERVSGWRFPC